MAADNTQSSGARTSVRSSSTLWHRAIPSALGFVLGSRYLRDADVFWHLTLGRAVLRRGSRTVAEPTAPHSWSEPNIVKDWLWDVCCYALHQAGGMELVGVLPSFFGALIAYRISRLIELGSRAGPHVLQTCLALLAVGASAEILDARPNLVLLTMVPLCVELSIRFTRAVEPRRELQLGAALALIQLLWAQLHSSFVLGPVLFTCIALEHRLGLRSSIPSRSALAAVLLTMLLATTTSAYGLSITALILPHASGDAVRHIQDMQPFDWSQLSLSWHSPLSIAVMCLVGIAGVIVGGVRGLSGITLAILGLLLTAMSGRFVYVAPALALWWACTGARLLEDSLAPRRFARLQSAAVGVTAIALALCASRIEGPLFHYGTSPESQPRAAAQYLARLPRGATVFTEFTLGPPLGFWLDGKQRTFVDGRTPVYFDDTDWGVARDMLSQSAALERGFARYGFVAAVVGRESSVCPLLEARWTPVVIEAQQTTFVPRGHGAAVPGLSPCGRNYLRADACSVPDSEWRGGLARQSALGASSFLQLMAAGMQLTCGRGVPDLAALPSIRDARAFLPTFHWIRASVLFAAHHPDDALAEIDVSLDDGDALAALSLLRPEAGEASVEATRVVLSRALGVMDDNAPASLRARMAWVCMGGGDAECARFHGLRAFLAGDSGVRPVLEWVARHHPHARVRADVNAWLQTGL